MKPFMICIHPHPFNILVIFNQDEIFTWYKLFIGFPMFDVIQNTKISGFCVKTMNKIKFIPIEYFRVKFRTSTLN